MVEYVPLVEIQLLNLIKTSLGEEREDVQSKHEVFEVPRAERTLTTMS
jgi:hypothetical protein